MNGTLSKSVIINPITICKRIRNRLYPILGIAWPYTYDADNDNFHILSEKSLIEFSDYEFQKLSLTLGKCIETETPHKDTVPIVTYRFPRKTSQGKVVMAKMNIEGAGFVIIIKSNQIKDTHKMMWIGDKKTVKLKTSNSVYRVISKSFMDAMCSVITSRMVEKSITPHFPLCYATAVNRVSFKRPRNEDDENTGTLCQSIWMEFLAQSMYEVLAASKDVSVWWSSFFQVAAGLCVANQMYDFIHNDLHSENVRVRVVPKKTKLYYETDDDIILEVPSGGFVFVIIDFGRAFIKPWVEDEALVSSVYGPHGECSSFVCDNPSIDMVRLVTSLEDTFHVIEDKKDRETLFQFCKRICQTDDNKDYFEELKNSEGAKFKYMLETYPRKHCHNALPKKIIPMFYNMYRIDKAPEGVKPFKLILK